MRTWLGYATVLFGLSGCGGTVTPAEAARQVDACMKAGTASKRTDEDRAKTLDRVFAGLVNLHAHARSEGNAEAARASVTIAGVVLKLRDEVFRGNPLGASIRPQVLQRARCGVDAMQGAEKTSEALTWIQTILQDHELFELVSK